MRRGVSSKVKNSRPQKVKLVSSDFLKRNGNKVEMVPDGPPLSSSSLHHFSHDTATSLTPLDPTVTPRQSTSHCQINRGTTPCPPPTMTVDYSLYYVTGRLLTPPGHDFYDNLAQACQGGVTLVQLREKHISTREMLEIATRCKLICDRVSTIYCPLHGIR
jgi:hypothetical protein